MPENHWYPAPSQRSPPVAQPSGTSDWNSQAMYPSPSEFQPLDEYGYASTNQGSVDLGLSPVVSQQSQNSHALHTFPDQEFSALPPSLDLSFVSDPSWTYSGPAVYNGLPGNAFVPSPDLCAQRYQHGGSTPQWSADLGGYQGSALPVLRSQDGQTRSPLTPYPTVAPGRPLLPRTEGPPSTMAYAHAPSQRPIRPLIQGRDSSRNPAQSVSTSASQGHAPSFGRRLAPGPSPDVKPRVHPATAMEQGHARTEDFTRISTRDMVPLIVDPAAEDFRAFIQFDQEEPTDSTPTLSYASGRAAVSSVPSTITLPEEYPAAAAKEETGSKTAQAVPVSKQAHSGEVDEGRHRNHELYSRGPAQDGMYHCPYKAEEGCPHKPTKLKCNYDKFIDSHLKPFRCKIEACAKQEFSSTACLLRHEREAHGMHGHGERPHLCYYPGCERGYPGNGFPRRYNLFDHMKRVHDHQESLASGLASPDIGSAEAPRKGSGRKRKATSPLVSEPAAHRQRISHSIPNEPVQQVAMPTMPIPRQEYPVMPSQVSQAPQVPYAVHYPAQSAMPMGPYQHAPMHGGWQQSIHSQWDTKRKELQRQLDYVRPDDQAGIQRFNHDLIDFRRLSDLSQEAHGK